MIYSDDMFNFVIFFISFFENYSIKYSLNFNFIFISVLCNVKRNMHGYIFQISIFSRKFIAFRIRKVKMFAWTTNSFLYQHS